MHGDINRPVFIACVGRKAGLKPVYFDCSYVRNLDFNAACRYIIQFFGGVAADPKKHCIIMTNAEKLLIRTDLLDDSRESGIFFLLRTYFAIKSNHYVLVAMTNTEDKDLDLEFVQSLHQLVMVR